MSDLPKLYHARPSYYSMIARLVLAEKQVQYERVLVDIHLMQQQNTAEYARINPNLTVPAFSSEQMLSSSDKILFFVDEHFSGPNLQDVNQGLMSELISFHYRIEIEDLTMGKFFGTRPKLREKSLTMLKDSKAHMESLAEKHDDVKQALLGKAALTASRINNFSTEHIQSTYETARADVEAYLEKIEPLLSQTSFVAGENYSLADVVTTTLLARIHMINHQDLSADKPNIQDYFNRMQQRASFQEADIWAKFYKRFIFGLILNKLKVMIEGSPF